MQLTVPHIFLRSKALFIQGLLSLAALLAFASGCVPMLPEDFKSEDELFAYSMELVEKGKTLEALRFLKEFRNRYPLSQRTPDVELAIGDMHFKQREYVEALASYQQFIQLHPAHRKNGYALLQTANAYMEQVPSTIDRDQTNVLQAISYYNQVANHPEFGKQAKENTTKLRRMLAERERYIADYYLKREQWKSAENRLLSLANNYAFDDFRDRALYDLVRIYVKLDNYKAASDQFDTLKQTGNQELINKASRLLQK